MAFTPDDFLFALLILMIFGLIAVFLFAIYKKNMQFNELAKASASEKTSANSDKPITHNNHGVSSGSKASSRRAVPARKIAKSFQHEWLVTSLKGHSGDVLDLDFSANGKNMISCSEDRTCLIWNVKEFQGKDRKFIKVLVELDHGSRVRYSPDSKAFILSLSNENSIRIFKIGKKDDGTPGNITPAFDFEQKYDKDIMEIGIASNGRFILTVHTDTQLKVWSLRGDLLSSVDSCQMNNNHGALSPCGRFIASCGFTSDVKIWEVVFDKSNNFKEVIRAFELKGHRAGVLSFDFNSDSTRMATVSKDGTWRLWDTQVRYQLGEDPKLLLSGDCVRAEGAQQPRLFRLALSPDARTLAIGCPSMTSEGGVVQLYELDSGAQVAELSDFGGLCSSLSFDTRSQYLVMAAGKQVQVLHNVPGLRVALRELSQKLEHAENRAARERLQLQVNEARQRLQAVLGPVTSTGDKKNQ